MVLMQDKTNLNKQDVMYRKIIAMYKLLDVNDTVVVLGNNGECFKKLITTELNVIETVNGILSADINSDVVICNDILECVDEPNILLNKIISSCNKIIVSYDGNERNKSSKWHTSELISYMQDKGYYITKTVDERYKYDFYILRFDKKEIVTMTEEKEDSELWLDKKYDLGLVCCINRNLGNNITNYALYQYLSDRGLDVCIIDMPKNTNFARVIKEENTELFLHNPYKISDFSGEFSNKYELSKLNDRCEGFVVGSDQLWRTDFIEGTDYHTCLDWVMSYKYKFSYATSFGVDEFEGDKEQQAKVKFWLNRFQKISVREESGMDVARKYFDVEAQQVVDPIFLCDKRYYENMAHLGNVYLDKKNFVGAYLLDVTSDKVDAVLQISNTYSEGRHIAILDVDTNYGGENERLNTVAYPKVEAWLATIKECDFFVTDSFHGMCFALLFHKPFCVIFSPENWRGITRIKFVLESLGLGKHLVYNYNEFKQRESELKNIDFSKVDTILSNEIFRSKEWMDKVLKEKEDFVGEYSKEDVVIENNTKLMELFNEKFKSMELYAKKTRNYTYMLSRFVESDIQIVAWGAGDCFTRNYSKIKEFYDIKYVCDSNPNKWNTEIAPGVVCISPDTLKEMKGVVVVIMVDNPVVAQKIANQLQEMGINKHDYVENWFRFIEE